MGTYEKTATDEKSVVNSHSNVGRTDFMPPTSKKFGWHIGLGLSVRLSGLTKRHLLSILG